MNAISLWIGCYLSGIKYGYQAYLDHNYFCVNILEDSVRERQILKNDQKKSLFRSLLKNFWYVPRNQLYQGFRIQAILRYRIAGNQVF